jgi:hypothetical protein
VVTSSDDQQAFARRKDKLDGLWDDWTGMSDVEGEERAVQSDGSPVVNPGEALTTLLVYAVQMALELGMDHSEIVALTTEISDSLRGEEDDEDDENGQDDEDDEDEENDEDDEDDENDAVAADGADEGELTAEARALLGDLPS